MSKIHAGSSATDKVVKSVALATIAPGHASHVVSAAVTTDHRLRLVKWHVKPKAKAIVPTKVHETEAPTGNVQEVAIAALVGATHGSGSESGPNIVVTAAIDSEGKLRVDTWGNDLEPLDSLPTNILGTGVQVAQTRTEAHGRRRVVTAIRDEQGKLRVDSWAIADNGAVTRRHHATQNPVKSIVLASDLTRTHLFNAALTARRPDGHIDDQDVSLDASDRPLISEPSSPKTHIGNFSICLLHDVRVIAAATDDEQLRIWPERANHSPGERASRVACCTLMAMDRFVVVAIRSQDNLLRLTTWRDLNNTVDDELWTDEVVENISVTECSRANDVAFVTACWAKDQPLKLNAWRVTLLPSHFFFLSLTRLVCLVNTIEVDLHDEPYLVTFMLDRRNGVSFRTANSRVFEGTNELSNAKVVASDVMTSQLLFQEEITDPDELIILIALMEHDDSIVEAEVMVAVDQTKSRARQLLKQGASRDDLVMDLRRTLGSALAEAAKLTNFQGSADDRIGSVQEVRLLSSDIESAKVGTHPMAVTFSTVGDTGTYVLHLKLVATQ